MVLSCPTIRFAFTLVVLPTWTVTWSLTVLKPFAEIWTL